MTSHTSPPLPLPTRPGGLATAAGTSLADTLAAIEAELRAEPSFSPLAVAVRVHGELLDRGAARIIDRPGSTELELAGLSVTACGSPYSDITNWCSAARRRLADGGT